jgi:hypothetical protein
MQARIVQRPETFDRVDRVKEVVGQEILPGDDRLWILGQPMRFVVDDADYITVPKGFTTDGASVPTIGQWLTGWGPWEEPQRLPAIAHDWLYTQPGVRKRRADSAFHCLLRSEGAGWWERSVMYLAVVVGGGPAYRADQRSGPIVRV